MRWSISNRSLGILLGILSLLPLSEAGYAAGLEADDAARHERMVEKYRKGWNRLIPRYGKVQYAGSMGLFSLGVGWDYGRKKQWETDFFLGYLPKFQGDKGHLTMTLKENYIPWRVDVGKRKCWKFEPFTVSLYFNRIFGEDFWVKEPDKYPHSFYGFPTALRVNLGFGQRARLDLKTGSRFEHMTFFYEFTTCDLYVVSYACNPKSLGLTDIFRLSLGIKLQFI